MSLNYDGSFPRCHVGQNKQDSSDSERPLPLLYNLCISPGSLCPARGPTLPLNFAQGCIGLMTRPRILAGAGQWTSASWRRNLAFWLYLIREASTHFLAVGQTDSFTSPSAVQPAPRHLEERRPHPPISSCPAAVKASPRGWRREDRGEHIQVRVLYGVCKENR